MSTLSAVGAVVGSREVGV